MNVQINTASEAELQALHGVGPALAARIVRHRLAHGPFSGPGDLAKVHGVGPALARTLAPHLDFGVPVPAKARDWKGVLVASALFPVAVFSLVAPMVTRLAEALRRGWVTGAPDWFWIWGLGISLVAGGLVMVCMASVAFRDFTRDPGRASRAARCANLAVLGKLAALPVMGAGLTALAPRYFPGGLAGFLANPFTPLLGSTSVYLPLLLGPPLLASTGHRWAHHPAARRTYDLAWLLGVPLLAVQGWTLWRNPQMLTPFIGTIYAGMGLVVLWQGIALVRTGPLFDPARYAFAAPPVEVVPPGAALAWLNGHRKSIAFQLALRDDLNGFFGPDGRRRTIGKVLIMSAVGFLGLVLGAVVEFEIQRVWEPLRCLVGLGCGG